MYNPYGGYPQGGYAPQPGAYPQQQGMYQDGSRMVDGQFQQQQQYGGQMPGQMPGQFGGAPGYGQMGYDQQGYGQQGAYGQQQQYGQQPAYGGGYGGYQTPSPYGYGGMGGGMPKRRALVIGCNYPGQSAHLNGCVNDSKFLKFLLQSKFQFPETEIVMLTDEGENDSSKQPTKANILRYIDWLVQGAGPGDNLFFSFSGHGGQQADENGDEGDGEDETILPTDFRTAGVIVDDDLHLRLCQKIPAGAKLIALMDCCHSGTGMDLPYSYDSSSGRVNVDRTAVAHGKTTPGEVVCFSGCRDDQTSADSKNLTKIAFSGVLTFCFTKVVESNYPNLTFESILQGITKIVNEKGFKQTVQLSAGHEVNVNAPFSM